MAANSRSLPSKQPVSPGHRAHDIARGVKPPSKPALIDHDFVADPRGGAPLVARHGVAVRDNRTQTKR